MLKAVVGNADESNAERHGRIPPPVDDAIEIARLHTSEQGPRAFLDGVEVLEQRLCTLRSDCGDIGRGLRTVRQS